MSTHPQTPDPALKPTDSATLRLLAWKPKPRPSPDQSRPLPNLEWYRQALCANFVSAPEGYDSKLSAQTCSAFWRALKQNAPKEAARQLLDFFKRDPRTFRLSGWTDKAIVTVILHNRTPEAAKAAAWFVKRWRRAQQETPVSWEDTGAFNAIPPIVETDTVTAWRWPDFPSEGFARIRLLSQQEEILRDMREALRKLDVPSHPTTYPLDKVFAAAQRSEEIGLKAASTELCGNTDAVGVIRWWADKWGLHPKHGGRR